MPPAACAVARSGPSAHSRLTDDLKLQPPRVLSYPEELASLHILVFCVHARVGGFWDMIDSAHW